MTNETVQSEQHIEPIAVSPNEAARISGVGRTTIYAALSSGELKSIKIGTRRLITVQAIRDWLGSDAITIHVEAIGPRKMEAAIEQVRATGAKVGLAFNPDTDPTLWFKFMDQVDLVMFMTVYPGFGGQSFIPEVRPFIQKTRAAFPELDIQVDGGLNRETIPTVIEDGANHLVCGSAYFKDADKPGFIKWAESL